MNVTNADFKAIENALRILPHGKDFDKLDKDTQAIIVDADETMLKLYRKKKETNKRTLDYINEKRKTNKNYAR